MTTALIAAAIVVALLALYVVTRPDTFELMRTRLIRAAPEEIYARIADLRRMNEWNPFVKKDKAIKEEYSGPVEGVGARYDFDGNRDVGAGNIEVIDAVPARSVTMLLTMTRPFAASNTIRFGLAPKAGGTEVTWTMSGRQPLMAKLMCLVVSMDRMVGREFEKGLAELAQLAEGPERA